jgi:hypothetical protein
MRHFVVGENKVVDPTKRVYIPKRFITLQFNLVNHAIFEQTLVYTLYSPFVHFLFSLAKMVVCGVLCVEGAKSPEVQDQANAQ